MDVSRFSEFDRQLKEKLADAIGEILNKGKRRGLFAGNGNKVSAIGFITTDDFYGFYLTWSYKEADIEEYYDWKNASYPSFLYQPLVDIVDNSKDIDLLHKSDEKWEFAQALLTVLEQNIKQLPDALFTENDCKRQDIKFFATMSDGDYIQEMLEASVSLFNK